MADQTCVMQPQGRAQTWSKTFSSHLASIWGGGAVQLYEIDIMTHAANNWETLCNTNKNGNNMRHTYFTATNKLWRGGWGWMMKKRFAFPSIAMIKKCTYTCKQRWNSFLPHLNPVYQCQCNQGWGGQKDAPSKSSLQVQPIIHPVMEMENFLPHKATK